MFASQIVRVSAVVLLVGGVLGLIGGLIPSDPAQGMSPLAITSGVLSLVGALLTVLALPGAYSRIARDAGWLGLLGFAGVMTAGIALGYFFGALGVVVFPWLAGLPVPSSALQEGPPTIFAYAMLFSFIALIGAVLFGLAILRTNIYSRWVGYLFILAGVVNLATNFVPNPSSLVQGLGGDLFYAAGIWLGYELWQTASETGLLGV